jgi:membrane protein YqaA with SNARE-associated domain
VRVYFEHPVLKHFSDILVAFGPWGIFLLNAIDSFGVPLPAATDVLLIGVAAASVKNPANAYFAALMAVLGSLGGNVGLYLAARQGRQWFRPAAAGAEPKGGRFQVWFRRYGLLSVFVPAVVPFVPLPLKVFVISAGAMHTRFASFFLVILLARVIRFFGEAYLGLLLGHDAQGFLARHGWLLACIALVTVVAIYGVMRLYGRHRAPAEM